MTGMRWTDEQLQAWWNRQTHPPILPQTSPPTATERPGTTAKVILPYLPDLCRAVGLPEPLSEYRFAPPRRWRFDWAWPNVRVAIEIEGGVWTQGRHTRGAGYVADLAKYNAAVLAGWRVLRYTPDQIRRKAMVDLQQLFGPVPLPVYDLIDRG